MTRVLAGEWRDSLSGHVVELDYFFCLLRFFCCTDEDSKYFLHPPSLQVLRACRTPDPLRCRPRRRRGPSRWTRLPRSISLCWPRPKPSSRWRQRSDRHWGASLRTAEACPRRRHRGRSWGSDWWDRPPRPPGAGRTGGRDPPPAAVRPAAACPWYGQRDAGAGGTVWPVRSWCWSLGRSARESRYDAKGGG